MNSDNTLLSEWDDEKYDTYARLYEMKDIEKESLEKGIEQEKKETIKNMLKENTDINFISRVTNKSIEEIEKIKNSLEK